MVQGIYVTLKRRSRSDTYDDPTGPITRKHDPALTTLVFSTLYLGRSKAAHSHFSSTASAEEKALPH